MANTKITSANLDTLTTLTVDDITIDGSTISDSGDLTLDVGGDIVLDAAGGDIILKNAGSTNGNIVLGDATSPTVTITSSADLTLDAVGDIILDADGDDIKIAEGGTVVMEIKHESSSIDFSLNTGDEDFKFKGIDGGSTITALQLDMSAAGAAIFNDSVTLKNTLSISDSAATTSGFLQASSNVLQLGTSSNDPVQFYANNANHMTLQADGKLAVTEIRHISAGNLEIGNDDEKQIFDASEQTIEFQTADVERMRITTSGVTYATGVEVRQHYATDNGSNKRYTAPLNPKIVETGLQMYVDPTKATDGTDFSPASHGNGNQDLTLGSGVSHGTNNDRAYWQFDGTSNASMYGNPNLSAGKSSSFSLWIYWNDVTSLNSGYQLNGIQIGNHYMYIGIVQGSNDSAPLYGYAGQGTNIPAGGSSASHEQAYVNSDEWVYLTIQSGHGTSSLTNRSHGRSEVYLNGTLVQRRSEIALPTVAANGSSSFYLGRVQGGYYLSGYVGPAVLYERTLHQWEILENMRVHADMYVA